jgi:hypothetical protein
MSDAKLGQRRRGDERLILTCLVIERLCAERVLASARLEAEIGSLDTQRLVVPLARRLTTRGYPDRHPYDAARIVAAA